MFGIILESFLHVIKESLALNTVKTSYQGPLISLGGDAINATRKSDKWVWTWLFREYVNKQVHKSSFLYCCNCIWPNVPTTTCSIIFYYFLEHLCFTSFNFYTKKSLFSLLVQKGENNGKKLPKNPIWYVLDCTPVSTSTSVSVSVAVYCFCCLCL